MKPEPQTQNPVETQNTPPVIGPTDRPWYVEANPDGKRFTVYSEHDSRAMREWRVNNPDSQSFRGVTICETHIHYNGSGRTCGPHVTLDLTQGLPLKGIFAKNYELITALK